MEIGLLSLSIYFFGIVDKKEEKSLLFAYFVGLSGILGCWEEEEERNLFLLKKVEVPKLFRLLFSFFILLIGLSDSLSLFSHCPWKSQ
ncbi:unnamed protein product [Brassica rapa subsp. narinosa]